MDAPIMEQMPVAAKPIRPSWRGRTEFLEFVKHQKAKNRGFVMQTQSACKSEADESLTLR